MNRKPYTFHSDGGHGWRQVPSTEIDALNIRDIISGYSYERDGQCYLEEDCDLGRFVDAKFPQVDRATTDAWMQANFAEAYTDGDSPIRRYPRFRRA